MGKHIDYSGHKFNRWLVIERAASNKKGAHYRCLCECGTERVVWIEDLKSEKSKSCGCIRSEMLADKNSKHSLRYTRIYGIWLTMRSRCKFPSQVGYMRYGGRGIKVCSEWDSDFMSFYAWAMKNGYQDNLTIDRIDNDGNYEPSNCRWSTYKEQANNRSNNVSRKRIEGSA